MTTDPIVAEVRAARDRLAARFDYDLEAIFRHVKAVEAKSGRSYVQCPPRTLAPREDDAGERGARAERPPRG